MKRLKNKFYYHLVSLVNLRASLTSVNYNSSYVTHLVVA